MASVVKLLLPLVLILNLFVACTSGTRDRSDEKLAEDIYFKTTQIADPEILEDAEMYLRKAMDLWLAKNDQQAVIHLAKTIAVITKATDHSEGELRQARNLMIEELEEIKSRVETGTIDDPALIFGPFQEAIILSGEILEFGLSARN